MTRNMKPILMMMFLFSLMPLQADILDTLRTYEPPQQLPQDLQSAEKHLLDRIDTYKRLGMSEEMIDSEIEKFERFKQTYLLAEIESLTSQDGEIKLPSKSISQENFGSIGRRIK